jgi:hypothetical protein
LFVNVDLNVNNGRAHFGHQWWKTTVLSCHRCLIDSGVKNELHLNIYYSFDHQVSLSKSKCWYSNNCLHFLKCAVPLASLTLLRLHPEVHPLFKTYGHPTISNLFWAPTGIWLVSYKCFLYPEADSIKPIWNAFSHSFCKLHHHNC